MAGSKGNPLRGVLSRLTTDPHDERLSHGVDDEPTTMAEVYLVADPDPEHPRVRPLRRSYRHDIALGGCGYVTTMGEAIAETYARRPHFYGATWCSHCSMHRPVGAGGEFTWLPGEREAAIPPEHVRVGT